MANKGDRVKNTILTAVIIIIVGLWVYHNLPGNNPLEEHGRIVVATVTSVNKSTGRHNHGYDAHFRYVYQGKRYSASHRSGTFNKAMTGRRYFARVIPGKKGRAKLYTDYPVPEWYNAIPPDTGWSRIPADADLRLLLRSQH